MRFWRKFSAIIIFLLALGACSDASSGKTYPLIIQSGKRQHSFAVEVADNDLMRERGLMFQKSLSPDKGMIFLFPKEQEVTFWMRNTYVPLDMIFIQSGGRISHIHHNAQPEDETGVPSNGRVTAVLEILGGQADILGIRIGDRIQLEGKTL